MSICQSQDLRVINEILTVPDVTVQKSLHQWRNRLQLSWQELQLLPLPCAASYQSDQQRC